MRGCEKTLVRPAQPGDPTTGAVVESAASHQVQAVITLISTRQKPEVKQNQKDVYNALLFIIMYKNVLLFRSNAHN